MSTQNDNTTAFQIGSIFAGLICAGLSWYLLAPLLSSIPLIILAIFIFAVTSWGIYEAFADDYGSSREPQTFGENAVSPTVSKMGLSDRDAWTGSSEGKMSNAPAALMTGTKTSTSKKTKSKPAAKIAKTTATKTAAPKATAPKATAAKKTVAKKATSAASVAKATKAPANKTVAKKASAAPKAAAPKAPAKKAVAKKAPAAQKTAAPKAAAPKAAKPKTTGPVRLKKAKGKADDLKLISGVGPKLEKTLNGLGFWHFYQIADWKRADVAIVDDELSFKGRIDRDNWIKQAKVLAKKKA